MVNGTLLNFGKRYKYNLRVIFDHWPKLHLGLDALSNQKIYSPNDFNNPNPLILNFLLSFRSNGSFAHASPTRCPTFEWFFTSWFQQGKFTCYGSQEYFSGLDNLSYSQVSPGVSNTCKVDFVKLKKKASQKPFLQQF